MTFHRLTVEPSKVEDSKPVVFFSVHTSFGGSVLLSPKPNCKKKKEKGFTHTMLTAGVVTFVESHYKGIPYCRFIVSSFCPFWIQWQ